MMTQDEARRFETWLAARADGIVMAKRHDYSGAVDPYRNFRKAQMFGVAPWRGVMIRLSDKLSRIESIMEAGGEMRVKDEALADTLADAINYIRILGGLCYEELGLEIPDED